MRWPHVEFSFKGLPVGFFEADVFPKKDGIYGYEPYRGLGHYQLGQHLRSVGPAECSYSNAGKIISFTVLAILELRKLSLADFRESS